MSDEIIQTKDLPEDKKEQTIVNLEQTNDSPEILDSISTTTEETKPLEVIETKPQETVPSAIEEKPIENKTELIENVVVSDLEKTNTSPEIIDSTSVKTEEKKIAETTETKPQEINSSPVEVKSVENKTEPITNVVVSDSVEKKNEPVVQTITSISVKSEAAVQPEKLSKIGNNSTIQVEIPKAVDVPVSKDILLIESFKANMLRAKELLVKARFAVQVKKKKKMEKIMILFVKNKKITNDNVREILSVSRSVALDYLNALKKENKIKQNGKGRGIFYTKA